MTKVECKLLDTVFQASHCKKAEDVFEAVTLGLSPHKGLMHTIKYDYGREFADHDAWAETLRPELTLRILIPLGRVY